MHRKAPSQADPRGSCRVLEDQAKQRLGRKERKTGGNPQVLDSQNPDNQQGMLCALGLLGCGQKEGGVFFQV